MSVHPVRLFGDPVLRARAVEVVDLDGVLFLDRLDPQTRKQAMREIRQAQWFGAPEPVVKLSPHPMLSKVR